MLFLHALPLDGSMWTAYADMCPGSFCAPTLYGLGDSVEQWADEALRRAAGDRLIVVGCSVGGSCALEVALAAPQRVAALVLIVTKARHVPDPGLHAEAVDLIANEGMEAAWAQYWAPLFSKSADEDIVTAARAKALCCSPADIASGVTAFHSRRSRDTSVPEIRCPVIVVTGEDDVAPGPEASTRLAASARRGRLHVVPSCGHYVPLEKPDRMRVILEEALRAGA